VITFAKENDGAQLDEHEDVVGEAVLTFRFGPGQSSQFEAGYQRDLTSSALGGWTRIDRGSLVLRSLLGRVFLLSVEAGAGKVRYGSLWGYDRDPLPANLDLLVPVALGVDGTQRHDIRLDGAIRGEYRATNWLSLMADVTAQAAITDFDYAIFSGGGNPTPDPARFFTIMAFAGVRAHY
jgi:hypothetical protein